MKNKNLEVSKDLSIFTPWIMKPSSPNKSRTGDVKDMLINNINYI